MKNIALVAHDGRKSELLEWINYNHKILEGCNLYATGTTGKLIKNLEISTDVREESVLLDDTVSNMVTNGNYVITTTPFMNNTTPLLSGPLGGDQQIGAMIAEGKIDCLIFFCDNLITQGHQQDVSALTRLAALYNIAFATNRTTADMIITSPLFRDDSYERVVPGVIEKYKNRQL